MIEIDGSRMEGGGQILRTSVGLSALTGKNVAVKNIRQGRCNPGLREQHLRAVKAVADLCGAKVKGLSIGSKKIVFKPGDQNKKKIKVRIRTAGSIGLVLQALSLPLMKAREQTRIIFEGGATSGKWAPPLDYLNNVTFPVFEKWGFTKPEVKVVRRGFYPKGEARAEAVFEPVQLEKNDLTKRGKVLRVKGLSVASKHLKSSKVADRQKKEVLKRMSDYSPEVRVEYVDAVSPGSCITLWAETENTVLGSDAIGEKGLPAEKVGGRACEGLLKAMKSGACVDEHMSDQVLPLLALAGGSVKLFEKTSHARTNMWVIERFLGKTFNVRENVVQAN